MGRADQTATIAAALVLVIGMGFGRFAFTGLYPLMVADQQISVAGGSYAASANYAGYLLGALLAALPLGMPSRKLCTLAVVTTVALLGLLALPLTEGLIVALRGVAGLSSAFAIVAASHWLIHDQGHHHGAPMLFSGVGIGIFLSAEMIAAGHQGLLSSRAIWLMLAIAALALGGVSIALQRRAEGAQTHQEPPSPHAADARPRPSLGATRLIVIYGLAGLGYIITATYLPLLVRTAFAAIDPAHIWAVFGLGAVPSCFLWHALHDRWGTRRSLLANLVVQAIGVTLPVLHTPASFIFSAILVGGTFMGTVTIAMPAARKLAGKVRFNMLAIMTASYGVGQIIGPLLANAIYWRTASFDTPLIIAALALVVAATFCLRHGGTAPSSRRP
ncbi:MFS transporter [Rhodospirillum rubrum]|uniref:YbfB/YjiJ family MFS transporter n=1 Tax=Rhodospirillum rubrum TaxID=1085 RepID=UPI0019036B0C|nr:YbfB/YjiJ family MFS transporter [Rhodospirillum rubrum]MBK1664313.1 MFS transporter [Rhodospirillum rubrum]MBK1677389.1 MFS transporter [Rhodospirillum rubrum]